MSGALELGKQTNIYKENIIIMDYSEKGLFHFNLAIETFKTTVSQFMKPQI